MKAPGVDAKGLPLLHYIYEAAHLAQSDYFLVGYIFLLTFDKSMVLIY
jgi:hypothetical protein